jgi:hypothetical protein
MGKKIHNKRSNKKSRSPSSDGNRKPSSKGDRYTADFKIDRAENKINTQKEIKRGDGAIDEERKQFEALDEDQQMEKKFGIKDFDTTKVYKKLSPE